MSEVVDASADRVAAVAAAVQALKDGELVVLPTDTLYGVAADAFNPEATAKIFAAKGRSKALPLPVLIRSQKQLLGLVTAIPAPVERLMAAYWPGPLTIVVEHDPNLMWDLGESKGTLAVRMPFDDVTLEVIRAIGPIACTSANLSGRRPAPSAQEAKDQLGDAVAVYLDAGERTGLSASTIVDCTRPEPHILREGPIPGIEALEVARGERDLMNVTVIDPPPALATAPADSIARLLAIPGLGPTKAAALIDRFGSVAGVACADLDQLTQVAGVGPALAQKALRELR
ncbi:MAG: L-threonylcarbamoyladenylate synthase [Glaciecola sp.]|jgi:L-threonylcarbamoyladenylate synthase